MLGSFLSLYFIFGTKIMPYMVLSSSVNLFSSSFVLLLLFLNKNEIKIGDHLKVAIEGLSECGSSCTEHMWIWVQYVGYNKGEI